MTGPRIILRREFEVHAAHRLEHYEGKCSNLHGHLFRIFISVADTYDLDKGFSLDFGELKRIVEENIINKLDHQNLNDVLPLNPTAENITLWCWFTLNKNCPDLDLDQIEVYETDKSCGIMTKEIYDEYKNSYYFDEFLDKMGANIIK